MHIKGQFPNMRGVLEAEEAKREYSPELAQHAAPPPAYEGWFGFGDDLKHTLGGIALIFAPVIAIGLIVLAFLLWV